MDEIEFLRPRQIAHNRLAAERARFEVHDRKDRTSAGEPFRFSSDQSSPILYLRLNFGVIMDRGTASVNDPFEISFLLHNRHNLAVAGVRHT